MSIFVRYHPALAVKASTLSGVSVRCKSDPNGERLHYVTAGHVNDRDCTGLVRYVKPSAVLGDREAIRQMTNCVGGFVIGHPSGPKACSMPVFAILLSGDYGNSSASASSGLVT